MSNSEIRMFVCAIIGLCMVYIGATNMVFGILTQAMGVLIVIYGFSPRMAKKIIKAIKDIATAPFRA